MREMGFSGLYFFSLLSFLFFTCDKKQLSNINSEKREDRKTPVDRYRYMCNNHMIASAQVRQCVMKSRAKSHIVVNVWQCTLFHYFAALFTDFAF